MSANTVTVDKTRTDHKSQYTDNPYFQNLHLHHELTTLLESKVYDNKWFTRVSKVLDIRKKVLTHKSKIHNFWEVTWGKLSIGRSISGKFTNIHWERPDDGPELIDDTNSDMRLKIIKFMLMGKLTEVLPKLDMSSYEKVGITKNWQRSKVKLNMTEIQGVVWADALTGEVATDDNYNDEIKILKGHIVIIIEEENLSFF